MIEAQHEVGGSFPVQFVWQLPDGDFVRAIFEAEVLALDASLDRYLLRLKRLSAGRQEQPDGEARPISTLSGPYWEMVKRLVGKRVYLAYEVEDGRAIRLRFTTLTGEHTLFSRLDDLPL